MTRNPVSLGPVFAYEWITSSRRWQSYAVRSCFVAAMLIALVVVRLKTDAPTSTSFRLLAQMAEQFFLAVSGTQLALVLLVAPVATAGAICLDRARGTLSHMLMTDLSDSEIVLGKLAARLIPVLGLLGCMLPVMELVALLGGVDPGALFGGFVVSVSVAVLGSSLAIVFSLWARKTHEALMATYAVLAVWLLVGRVVDLVASRLGWVLSKPTIVADPFYLALAPYWWPASVDGSDYLWFVGTTLVLSAVLVGVTVFSLRSVCKREKVEQAASRRAMNRLAGVWRSVCGRIPGLYPSLDGNPVLWREWHRSRPSRLTTLIVAVFGGFSVLCSGAVIAWPGGPACAWVNGLQVSIGLLLLSVASSSSLAEERARGSLDLLLSTPLSAREIVIGKWLGTFRLVPLLAVMPALVIAAGAIANNWKLVWLTFLLIAYVLVSGAAIGSLGIAMATWFSRPGRAVGATVTLYVLVAVLWLIGEQGMAMGSPFYWAGKLTLEVSNPNRDIDFGWAIFWTVASAWVAKQLLLFTLQHFEGTLGRMAQPVAASAGLSTGVRVVQRIYPWVMVAAVIIALDPIWGPPALAFQFTLGSLLLALHGAGTPSERQGIPDAREAAIGPGSSATAVRGWLVPNVRLVVPVITPVLIGTLIHATQRDFWFRFVAIAIYAFSVGAAFLSLGLAVSRSRGRRGSTTGSVIVIWALLSAGVLVLFAFLGGESSLAALALGMASPFLGVHALSTSLMHSGPDSPGVTALAFFWTFVYLIATAMLLRKAGHQSTGDEAVLFPRALHPQLTTETQ